ncbi:RluA family pseudouridine synthase [Patescibacteria group bacterium]|nr:RluA family pseudouridine synthase [Patescibacteria group bacterium]
MSVINIIYEDDDVLVVNKPSGLVVHSDGKTKEITLSDWAVSHYPQIKGVGESLILSDGTTVERHGIVHRLDRETSGVMVLAKNQEAFLFLKNQFEKREIKKIYNAFVYGKLKEKEGTIDKPIARSSSDFRKWSAQEGMRGKEREAVTSYTVLEDCADASFVEITPTTGRTHQIRVHFKAINHPLVCDSLYAPKRKCLFGFDRLALHARILTTSLPKGGTATLEAELPNDFKTALTELAKLKQSI